MMDREFRPFKRRGDKYSAPPLFGYEHVGNTSDDTPNESISQYGHPEEIIARPFFPEPLDGGPLDKYRIKWALYRIVKEN